MQHTSRFYLEATHQLQLKDLSGMKIQPEEDEAMEDLLSQPHQAQPAVEQFWERIIPTHLLELRITFNHLLKQS